MTKYSIPALVLAVTALACAVNWLLEWRAGRRRQAEGAPIVKGVLLPVASALAGLAMLVGLGLALESPDGHLAGLAGVIACAVLIPVLLVAEGLAVISTLRLGGKIGRGLAVSLTGFVFAIGSCFAVLN